MTEKSNERDGPRRRPAAGGYARGDEKRLLIIEAAVNAFGALGYERASTRQIAEDAGVNPPALQYYFESKEGLYRACAEHVTSQSYEAMLPAYEAAALVVEGDQAGAVRALLALLDRLADLLFASSRMEGWSRFLARGQSEEAGAGLMLLRQKLGGVVHANCARLVGIATGLPPEGIQTRLVASSVLGLVTMFHLSRANALAVLGWPDFGGERLALLKAMAHRNALAILRAAEEEDASPQ